MQFPNDLDNPNIFCVGHREVINVKKMKAKGGEYKKIILLILYFIKNPYTGNFMI